MTVYFLVSKKTLTRSLGLLDEVMAIVMRRNDMDQYILCVRKLTTVFRVYTSFASEDFVNYLQERTFC